MKSYVKRNFFISELRNISFFLSICKDFLRDDTKLFLCQQKKWRHKNGLQKIRRMLLYKNGPR